ncbi:MAG: hypothetical protein CV087_08430 [Candidatus Brocadia sp. WS118]|nr:MAG: hypothetical protein CV087_08430 [Candidatus Brocadia sp. WS118]
MKIKVLNKETILSGFLTVERALLEHEMFNGAEAQKIERLAVKRRESVGILLFDAVNNEFLLVRQFRYPAYAHNPENGWLLELIAGYIDDGEAPIDAAKREAEEETGYKLRHIQKMAEFYLSPGYSTEYMHLFYGVIGKKISAGGGLESEGEDIQIVRVNADSVENSDLLDAKTILAINLFK